MRCSWACPWQRCCRGGCGHGGPGANTPAWRSLSWFLAWGSWVLQMLCAFWAYFAVVKDVRNGKHKLWKGILLGSVGEGSKAAPCVHCWPGGGYGGCPPPPPPPHCFGEMETARTFTTQTINFRGVTMVLRPVHKANSTFFYKTTNLCQRRRGARAAPRVARAMLSCPPWATAALAAPACPQPRSVLEQPSVPCSFSLRRTLVLNLLFSLFWIS